MFTIGIDVGGTYTDLVAIDEHHNVVFAFEAARQRNPALSAPGQSVEQNQRRLAPSRSQVVNGDAIDFADSAHLIRH